MVNSFKILLISSIAIMACQVRYAKLTYQRTNYLGDEIVTQGYFYCMDTLESHFQGNLEREPIVRTLFFYKNGALLSLNIPFDDFDELERTLMDTSFLLTLKEVPYGWGIFLINNREITINEWAPGTGGKHPSFVYKLDIVNDTTIYHAYGEDTYHFRRFTPKPDSVNRFVN